MFILMKIVYIEISVTGHTGMINLINTDSIIVYRICG